MIAVSRSRVGVVLSLALGVLVMPLAALAVDKPNLKVTSLTSPFLTTPEVTHVLPGDPIKITAIVTNLGPVATQVPPQSDNATKFFLVPTSGQKKNLKGIQIIKTPLAPGESDGSEGTYFLFSDTVAGTYKLQACADGFDLVDESDDSTNDNCTTSTGTIIVDQAPDLIVSSIKTPSLPNNSVGLGGTFEVKHTVKNIGPAPSGKSVTTYFLVSGPPLNITKDLKGPLDHPPVVPGGPVVPAEVPALAEGETSDEQTEKVTVRPEETAPGTYFLKACADGKKALPEQDNDNNCLTSSGSFKVVAMPNLVVTSLAVDPPLPRTLSPGDPLVITTVVTNQGGVTTGKESALKAVLVKVKTAPEDPEVTKNLRLNAPLKVPSLAGGASATIESAANVTIYSDTLPGTYFVRMCADLNKVISEAVESDNCMDSNDPDTTKTVTVLGPTSSADLQVASVTDVDCSPSSCTDVDPGDNISAKVTIVNSGTEAVAASVANPLTISFKLIQGTKEKNLKVLDADSMLITQPILPGASLGPLPIEVEVFSDTLAGDYDVQVCVDEPKKFAESNNNNNCKTELVCSTTAIDPLVTAIPPTPNTGNRCPGAPVACTFGTGGTCTGQFRQITPATIVTVHGVSNTGANLVVTALSNPPSFAALGDKFSVTITAKNTGVAAAGAASHTTYLLVTTGTPPVLVTDLSGPATNTIPALGAGDAITDKKDVTIQTNTPLGEYKVQVCLDSHEVVSEINENDNCKTSSGKIEVRGLPDYVVTSLAVTNAPPQVKRGAKLNLTAKVTNQGIGNAMKDSILKFDLVSTTGSPTSALTGTKTIAKLDAGESTAVLTASVTVPNNAPLGTHKVRACADATKVLPESATGPLGTSEQNNCTITTTTVEVIQ